MKFTLTYALIALLSSTALAQRVAIGFPADGTSVTAGSELTVEIDRPNTLSASTEVGVVLAVQACTPICASPDDILGRILYNGPYAPALSHDEKPPHQNFTVTIPSNLQGFVQFAVAHVSLIGAGPQLFSETLNITLNVV